jgi:hypothetical protein
MNRRESLGLFSAALAAPALLQAAGGAAASAAALDPLHTHVRLRARADGKPVYFPYEGTFYAQRSGQRTVALLHIEGASASTTTRQPDGSWLYTLREAGWFCDLETHAVLPTWVNPLSGRSVTPEHYNSRQQLLFTSTGVKPASASPLPPGLEWQGQLTVPVVMGDDVWSAEELFVRVPAKTPDELANVQTSLATLHARLADLRRPDSAWVPSTLAYQTLASWRPWMQMPADMPGVMSWRLFGRKCEHIDELPAALRERVQAQHPEVLQL